MNRITVFLHPTGFINNAVMTGIAIPDGFFTAQHGIFPCNRKQPPVQTYSYSWGGTETVYWSFTKIE
jgi:hypothetical protein